MKHLCPVCGYDALETPPAEYSICPCCGTEFGYDDVAHSFDELRDRWILAGARWFSDHTPPPPNWSVSRQLEKLYRPRSGQIVDVTLSQRVPDEGGTVAEVEETKARAETTRVKVKAAA